MRLLLLLGLFFILSAPAMANPASVQMTKSFTLTLKIKAKAGYHINKDAPLKIELTSISPSGIIGPTEKITIETPSEKLTTYDIKFKPDTTFKPGRYNFNFNVRGVICDNKGENCIIVKTTGTVCIDVVKSSATNKVMAHIKLDETKNTFKVDASQ